MIIIPKLNNRIEVPICNCLNEELDSSKYPLKMKRSYVKVNIKTDIRVSEITGGNYYSTKKVKWIAIGWFCGNCGNSIQDIDINEFRVKYCSQAIGYDSSYTNITHCKSL